MLKSASGFRAVRKCVPVAGVVSLILVGCTRTEVDPVRLGFPLHLQGSLKDEAVSQPVTVAMKPTARGPIAEPKPIRIAAAHKPPVIVALQPPKPNPGLPRVPSSFDPIGVCGGAGICAEELRKILASDKREWMQKRVSPSVYATGARPFAYRILRTSLTCQELVRALEEVVEADEVFDAPPVDISKEQAARISGLNAQVLKELRSESAARC